MAAVLSTAGFDAAAVVAFAAGCDVGVFGVADLGAGAFVAGALAGAVLGGLTLVEAAFAGVALEAAALVEAAFGASTFLAAAVFDIVAVDLATLEVVAVFDAYRTRTWPSSALRGLEKGDVRVVVRHIAPYCGSKKRGIDVLEAMVREYYQPAAGAGRRSSSKGGTPN